MSKLLTWLCCALLLALPAVPAAALEVGSTPPDFELPSIEGPPVRLSDFQGRPIVLKLATTWCATCKQQSAELRYAAPFLQENGVAVIEVFLQDTDKMVRQHLEWSGKRKGFFSLIDDGQVRRAYSIFMIPRVLLIAPDFTVRRDGSMMSSKELTKALGKLIDKGGKPAS